MNAREIAIRYWELANAQNWERFALLLAPTMTGLTVFDLGEGVIRRLTDCWSGDYEPPPRAPRHVVRY